MRIAFFINGLYNSGGTERVSTVIANELAKDRNNTVFMISRVKSPPFFPLPSEVTYLYLSEKQESHYSHYLKYVFKIARIVKKHKIEKWVDVCSAMSLMSIPAKLFVRFNIYTWEHFNLTVEWNPVTNKLARSLACKYAQKVIVLTQTDKIRFEEKYKSSNVLCIPNPVTINQKDKIDVTLNRTIISIGRYTTQKGYDMLLEIWGLTRAKGSSWKLHIVGDGEMRKELTNKVYSLGLEESVELAYPTKDVEKTYQKAAFFVMSSRFEGLPLVLIEAMSVGLPIISFDCETGPRDVVQDGYNGYLVNCFNLEQYARKIDELCENTKERERLSKNAIQKSKAFQVDTIMSLWKTLLSK